VILMIDNYDSFTYNLVQELSELSRVEVEVVRNDAAPAAELVAMAPQAVVISPGPGTPQAAGVCLELISALSSVPLLGVCLGHQALAAVEGGRVVRAPEPVHGKVSAIRHDGSRLFAGLPDPFPAARYHSLVVERSSLPDALAVTAWSDDGLVMGLEHRSLPRWGVQFHPESYLTRDGMLLLARFLELAGVPLVARWESRLEGG
jgi:anthranilate synthase component 2